MAFERSKDVHIPLLALRPVGGGTKLYVKVEAIDLYPSQFDQECNQEVNSAPTTVRYFLLNNWLNSHLAQQRYDEAYIVCVVVAKDKYKNETKQT